MSKYKQGLGKSGENLALRFLRGQGYQILRRNFSCYFGEIDIIARKDTALVFIEVKTRASSDYGPPQEAIDTRKIKHIIRCAQYYLYKHAPETADFRFDVVAITLNDPTHIELFEAAFSAPGELFL